MTATMTVTVRDRAIESRQWGSPSYQGPVLRRVTISTTCPRCGGPRGVPRSRTEHDDGDWYAVSVWDNPCGHVDSYVAVLAEARQAMAVPSGGVA